MTDFGIYGIHNMVSDKWYVGQTAQSFKERWRVHVRELKAGRHKNIHFQRSWNKHGESVFEFVELEKFDEANLEQLTERESYWMIKKKALGEGYNICPAGGSSLGVKRRPETRRKISLLNKGRKHTIEARRKRAGDKTKKAKLTWAKVDEIRRRYEVSKKETYRSLAKEFEVGKTTIQWIIERRTWNLRPNTI